MPSPYLDLPRRSQEEVALVRLLTAIEDAQNWHSKSSDPFISSIFACCDRYVDIRLRKSSSAERTDLMDAVEACKAQPPRSI